jgi:hypothetical protein
MSARRCVPDLALWDFEVRSFGTNQEDGDDSLVIVGSRDLTYYYDAKVTFLGVDYLALPTRFSHGLFRLATADEIASLSAHVEPSSRVYCIVEAHGSADERNHFLVAEEAIVLIETVTVQSGRVLRHLDDVGELLSCSRDVGATG